MKVALIWFRQDLRFNDNPALIAAIEAGYLPIGIFIKHSKDPNTPSPGEASDWWLHQSLNKLRLNLEKHNISLILDRGPYLETLGRWITKQKAEALFFNRCYEPNATISDTKIKEHFQKNGFKVQSFNSALLFEPWEIQSKQQTPYQVFTPFWKNCLEIGLNDNVLLFPPKYQAPQLEQKSDGLSLDSLSLMPTLNWWQNIASHWQPGEDAAAQVLNAFAAKAINSYQDNRNCPSIEGTSSLSPYLHFGEISPRQILNLLKKHHDKTKTQNKESRNTFIKELGWREFAYHLLYHFPNSPLEPLRPKFKKFPWLQNPAHLLHWQKGETGYPLIDAGMRQLWQIGWMHNRVRMAVASFLVKDLLISWQDGASWFLNTLVDADLANNTLGWQWAGGCGADAAPYFRIFNPVLQSQKFDPHGDYIKLYIPELSKLPTAWLHKPWLAPPDVLKKAGVSLGKTYPLPIVDHTVARKRALAALATIVQ